MANRRMFSRTLTGSGRFLRLSPTARALYYDLGMEADDDGFVEAFVRLRATGAEEVHLDELEQAGLILILDREDLVVHIRDWTLNNALRRDRYTPSVYRSVYPWCVESEAQPEVQQPAPLPEAPAIQEEPMEEQSSQPSDNQVATAGEPTGVFLSDSLATQVRLGKDRVGKGSLGKVSSVQSNIGQNRAVEFYKEGGDFKHARGKKAPSKPLLENSFKPDILEPNSAVFSDYPIKAEHFQSRSLNAPPCHL